MYNNTFLLKAQHKKQLTQKQILTTTYELNLGIIKCVRDLDMVRGSAFHQLTILATTFHNIIRKK